MYSNKTYATGFVKPKTTSLLFDYICLPNEMAFCDDETINRMVNKWIFITEFGARAYKSAIIANVCSNIHIINECIIDKNIGANTISNKEPEYYTSHHRHFTINQYAKNIKNRFDVDVTPIYHDLTQFDLEFNLNQEYQKLSLLQLCMDNLPEIDESLLEWRQVYEFRKDKSSLSKLRKFRLWLFTELTEKTKEEISYIFEKELDDYKFALKKHGIMTYVGGGTALLAAYGTILGSINSGLFSLIAAGITITTGLGIFAVNQIVDYFETTRNPIAYIYDISKKIKSNA